MDTLAGKLDFALRIAVLILTLTVGMALLFAGARSALAATLKPEAVVTGNVFTVGDLFAGLDRDIADRVLGPAPEPGRDMVLNARTLMRVAAALELPWQPGSSTERIVVRRAAALVDASAIEDAVRTRLRADGLGDAFAVSFLGDVPPSLILPQGLPTTAEVTALDYDPRHGRFTARIAAPSQTNPVAVADIAGTATALVSVPVLKRPVSAGTVIGAGDIAWLDVAQDSLQGDTVLKEEELTGLTPRRMAAAGKPVRAGALERPQLVTRGDSVTITYHDGTLQLTAQGKALQGGAKGDPIRVVNLASSRPVDAFVETASAVAVYP